MSTMGGEALGGWALEARSEIFAGRCVQAGPVRIVPLCRVRSFGAAGAAGHVAGGGAEIEILAAVVRDGAGRVRMAAVGEGDPFELWQIILQEAPELPERIKDLLA